MHLINAQYRILDVFEKNPLQSLMLGSSVENPEDIVVINEVIWSPLFTRELIESLFSGFINLRTHSEDDFSCQLVTAYHKGMPINKYLSSRTLPFRNRINLCYEFLKTMVSYNDFPPWIQDILIDEDQIIVWDDQLLYNELLILKTDNADYGEKISFTKVQKKIHRIIGMLTGDSLDASPALLGFLEGLKGNAAELDSLHSIYDGFQKVYLYDYYLDQDDSLQSAPIVIPVPIVVPVPIVQPDEDDMEIPDDKQEDPVPEKEETLIPPPVEMDSVDADMEKNLELFFNRNRQESENSAGKENNPKKFRNWFWIMMGIAGLSIAVWAASQFFMSAKAPVASYTSTKNDTVWVLENKSTFSDKTSFKRCEWTVFQNGKLIDLYDTYDLTLALEEEGIYQVVLRVMDSDGNWSNLYQTALENHPSGNSPETPQSGANLNTGTVSDEKMGQFALKFSDDRTHKDSAFFRTGSYSLQVSPGSKAEFIEVKGFLLDNNGMVSIWIASENADEVTLVFTGYNQNSKVFSKEISYKPMTPWQWEMRQFTVESDKPVNRMTISVKGNSLINLDDLTIDSYK